MIELFVALALGFGFSAAIRWMIRVHQRRTASMRMYRAIFFQMANALVEKDCLTDVQLWHLRALVDEIDKPAALRSLGNAVREVDRANRAGTFVPNPKITSEDWASLLYYYFMALTHLRHLRGWRVRAMLANVLEPKVSAVNTVAIEKYAYKIRLQEA